ncbi:hypothetical protein Vafri_18061 [Volvox africanus]|uniref:Uncharacterized protein n=1 Tax=Volvox africanus TaxID=51714 RepID=A0A8J4BRV8_9CHLO|nr:hypothetical protein Vafri_18061 [Volvox africanus]
MATVRNNSSQPRSTLPTSEKAPENRISPNTDSEMQAVAESAHEHTQREISIMQEHIQQLQTALSTSRSEAQQARDENKRLAGQMATTQQLLAMAETEARELRRQLGDKLMATRKEAQEIHQGYCSEVRRALRAEIEIEEETVRQLRAGNIEAVIQLQAKKKTFRRWKVEADGAVLIGSTTEEGGEDAVMLRARCGALRRELVSTQAQLAAVTQALEAAAQGRLAEKMEARAAVDTGRVKNDEDVWALKNEVWGWKAGALGNSSKCGGHSMSLHSSRQSLQRGAPVGNLADELVDIYSLYQIPAMPKYEFSTLS